MVTGLYGGCHSSGGLKGRKATKAAAEGKSAHWRSSNCAGLGRPPQRGAKAETLIHTTKKGRCQKVRKTATRTLPPASIAAATNASGRAGGGGSVGELHPLSETEGESHSHF